NLQYDAPACYLGLGDLRSRSTVTIWWLPVRTKVTTCPSALAVIRFRAVLPEVMLVAQGLGNRADRRIDRHRHPGHRRNLLDERRRVRGIRDRLSPAEGRVPRDEARWTGERVESAHAADDGDSGIRFVLRFDLAAHQRLGQRDRPVEIIGVRRAKAGDLA